MASIAFDLDGTLTGYSDRLGPIMRSLRAQGVEVIIVTGTHTPAQFLSSQDYDKKCAQIQQLGLTDAYDRLVVVAGPQSEIANRKAMYLSSVGCPIMIDNSKRNARACTAAGILALVPWGVRSEY